MIPMTLADIAEVVGGRLVDVPDADAVVTGTVEYDSRRVAPGGLFVALKGNRVDGHEYADPAVAAGAVAVLGSRPLGVPTIVVDPDPGAVVEGAELYDNDGDGAAASVLRALGALAHASVTRLVEQTGMTVVGVTGSAGKTSTKDLLATLLAPLGPVVAPPGSFNNELGHPWTALRADETTRTLVLELSARGAGHIAALARIAPLKLGVVLNVGTAHLGTFGSRDAIAEAKGELIEALPPADQGGVAVLNVDDPMVAAMAARTVARVVPVGQSTLARVRAIDVRLDGAARAEFTLVTPDGSAPVELAVHGEHQVGNALAAAAVALECGVELDEVARLLGEAVPASARRMDVRTRADAVTVVNDSYNANPDSMRAALRALATMSRGEPAHGVPMPARGKRRTWAVLGEMAELGPDTVVEHDAIGRHAVRLDVENIVIVGAGRSTRAMYQGAVQEGSWSGEAVHVADADEALALLRAELAPGDLVLVKASQVVGLWRVADELLSDEPADRSGTDAGDRA